MAYSPTVTVIGLGYVGLPLATAFGRSGLTTIGFDINRQRVDDLRRHLDRSGELSSKDLAASAAYFTADEADLAGTDFFIVAVPTPVTQANHPDLSLVAAASETVGRAIKKEGIAVYESTVYPGVTEEFCSPIIERVSGLKRGRDFKLGYSPERINPGDKEHTLEKIVKVIAGEDDATTDKIASVYERICLAGIFRAASIKTAEAAKIIENTQRDLNIALMNELSLIFHRLGLNTHDVLEAAGTKWNFLKFTPGLVGGHCLAGSHRITILNDHHHKVRQLNTLWPELIAQDKVTKRQLGNTTLLWPKERLKLLSYNKVKEQAEFATVKCFSLRPQANGFRIATAGNHSLEVSDRHPVIIDENGTWFVKLAKDVRIGDRLPLLQDLPQRNGLRQEIDLIAEMPSSWHQRYRVKRKIGTWRDLKDHLTIKKRTGIKASNFYHLDYLPLSVYLVLEKAGVMPLTRRDILIVSGRGGGSFQTIPAIIELDASFARLIGYYLAEGCITHDKSSRVRFAFFRQEKETIADCRQLIAGLGLRRHSVYEDKQWQTTHIKASSELLSYLIEHVLGCGVRSEDARVPEELLYASDTIRWNVLTGALRGDGGVDWQYSHRPYQKNGKTYAHTRNIASINYFSSSPKLFHEIQLLLMSFGITFSVDKKRPLLVIAGTENIAKLHHCFADSKKGKLDNYFAHKLKSPKSKVFQRFGKYATVVVKNINPLILPEVYSIEVEGTHTIVSDGGLITHNCIGVDPYYLVHKAIEVGYHPQIIAAGRRVNDFMPEFVAQETVKGLIAAGKTIQKAKVLVLGLTFKENVKDVRNSKIKDTIIKLQELGVTIFAYDPLLNQQEIQAEFPTVSVITSLSGGPYDAIIIATPHQKIIAEAAQFLKLGHSPLIVMDIKAALPELRHHTNVVYKSL